MPEPQKVSMYLSEAVVTELLAKHIKRDIPVNEVVRRAVSLWVALEDYHAEGCEIKIVVIPPRKKRRFGKSSREAFRLRLKEFEQTTT